MAQDPTDITIDKESVDYDAFYRGRPLTAETDVAYPQVPWDIGEAQPAVVELVEAADFRGPVLDAGCGPGDNAVLLARRGHEVTAFDSSTAALREARERAAALGARVDFVEADATHLTELEGRRFATVLDSALYHCLDDAQRREYVAALHRVTEPGAELHLICWAEGTAGVRQPMVVSEENLRTVIGTCWDITAVRLTSLTTAVVPSSLTDADLDRFRRLGVTIDRERVRVDGEGRIVGPAWYLHAVRR
ncbi:MULTISPECIES: class I SAM-dependent methyltransferase [unclassified Streptomyces]|uniref:class I SAM-dependent methyltransferase n=1 Tax=unclassified Streptomyces TaxID=2593676 RepID=UPI00278C2005|nr:MULTISPECIES: class I SAM-dependent methyltransferase [unclassified Streptomyces]